MKHTRVNDMKKELRAMLLLELNLKNVHRTKNVVEGMND